MVKTLPCSGLSADDGYGTGTHRPGAWKPLSKLQCAFCRRTENSLAFAVGEPVTYVQAPKAKGHGSRASFGFPTPRSRVYKGSLRGRTADVSPLAQVEELPLIPPETTAHYIPSHTGRLIRVAPMLYAIAQESSSSISNTYRRRRVTGNCVGAIT